MDEAEYHDRVWSECVDDHPIRRRVDYVTFASRSNGRPRTESERRNGRAPRRERDVELVGWRGTYWEVKDTVPGGLDRVLEAEILDGYEIPSGTTPYEFVVRVLRERG